MFLKLHARRLPWRCTTASAHDVFAAYPECFAALLENPTGGGRQVLATRAGQSMAVRADGQTLPAGLDVFTAWRKRLAAAEVSDIFGIRCLMYAAYEAGGLMERLPSPKGPAPLVLMWIHFPVASIAFLPEEGEVHLCSTQSEAHLDELETMLASPRAAPPPRFSLTVDHVTDADAYKQAVRRVKDYIAAGDIFQANIARFWSASFAEVEAPALYARLRQVNPAPFACFLRVEANGAPLTILSASPERLFRISPDGWVDTRPIAGTRKRGKGKQDRLLEAELLLSEKERAEHIMLVDLERNDLGRVCVPGTVEVNERMVIERYATVQHIVSNVRGRLRPDKDVVDLFTAMFPGGTITGCPKIRCMEIIHELEEQARGPYTGGIGYVGWNGCADMNILIRSFWLYRNTLHWAAGAGIVADSDPQQELLETEHKAAGLLRAFH